MVLLRVQHSLQGSSGLPEDQYVNTFYVTGGAPITGSNLDDIHTAIKNFYSDSPGPWAALSTWLGKGADAAGARIKTYDMADALPRTPLRDETFGYPTFGSGSGMSLPQELACCLSYKAAPVAGQPAARLRGRIYIGPLDLGVLEGSPTTDNHPISGFVTSMLQAGRILHVQLELADFQWVVYSPTSGLSHDIVELWVDNAWDIQRRRGVKPTSRVVESDLS